MRRPAYTSSVGRSIALCAEQHGSGGTRIPKKNRGLTEERMILAGFILVISTALAAFYLLVTIQRILRAPIRRK